MLALQWQLDRSQWWPRETLIEHQMQQLRALVRHAVENVPHYRRAPGAARLADVNNLDPTSFLRWPILRKSEVQANERALRARGYPESHGRLLQNRTTGSTGIPLRVFHTEVAQFFAHALVIRDHLLHQRDLTAKIGLIHGDVRRETSLSAWGLASGVFQTGPSCGNSPFVEVEALLDWLLRERPAYLIAYPTVIRALIASAASRGVVPSGLQQLVCFGEAMPAELRQLALEHWGAAVVDGYSCNEAGGLAVQCPGHSHYLVQAENVYLEVLREDGSPCAPGETGRVVVTNLHNFAMPLIRYELGDYAELGDRCPTGRGLPVLTGIMGRVRNMLRDPRGGRRWPKFGRDWEAIGPIRQARLVQRALDAIEVQYVMDRDLSAAEMERLVSIMHRQLGYPFSVTATRVPRIERGPGGKFEEFLSLLD